MLDDNPNENPIETTSAPVVKKSTRTRATKKAVVVPETSVQDTLPDASSEAGDEALVAPAAKKTATKKAATKKAAASKTAAKKAPAKKAASKTAAKKAPAKKAASKTAASKTATTQAAESEVTAEVEATSTQSPATGIAPLFQAPVVTTTRRTRTAKKLVEVPVTEAESAEPGEQATAPVEETAPVKKTAAKKTTAKKAAAKKTAAKKATAKKTATKKAAETPAPESDDTLDPTELVDAEALDEAQAAADGGADADGGDTDSDSDTEAGEGNGPARRRRRRGGRRRRKSGDGATDATSEGSEGSDEASADDSTSEEGDDAEKAAGTADGEQGEGSSRRRRRRRRAGEDAGDGDDDPNTVTRVRNRRAPEDQITALAGSTRLEAKKQRRREGREAGRRRAPIVSEAEFLARREAVDRVMVIRQRKELTQIAVLEDKVLVEHYVARESQTSLIGNVYLGRVQNVLPSMEAAFIDIGKGRNAVLYAGEVNWSALGHKDGQPRKIESVLSSGQSVLVQVTKDPIGQKGARLTSQVSLAGRFLVYVPDGTTSGISRKLPDTERNRLKKLLKEIVPDTAGVIVRTAAEGASEDELTHDVERLKARWEDIEAKAKGKSPQLLYGEPDLTLKVVRDLFTEDFAKLVIEGDDAWETVQGYVTHVAPDLADRLEKFEPATEGRAAGKDVFGAYRIEEQIAKGLDRKVWLPSGGSLIIDRTEAMTVVDVNTGKFTGSGGNLEETVTKNNLEAAEEIVRQLRLRDIGGIIVVDFIDMVLESNRDLVVRRLVECLGRDRTRHQVAEVTSLGLVQMTRKRIGTGLLEAFSTDCEHCHGRGVVVASEPVEPKGESDEGERRSSGRRGRGRGRGESAASSSAASPAPVPAPAPAPSPRDVAAMPRAEKPPVEPTEPIEPADQVENVTADDVAPEPVASEPVAPEPVVSEPVTVQTRRRTPRKVAPVTVEPPAEAVGEQPAETQVEAYDKGAEPAAPAPAVAETEAVAEPAESVESSKPKVVTRSRRRSATRPAGPPPVEPVAATEHVPIKKRGTRKR